MTLLSRLLGLVREQLFAMLLGAGFYSDAFQIAFRIPNLLRDLFAEGALSAAFVPTFTDYLTNRSREEAYHLANRVMTVLATLLGALVVATRPARLLGKIQALAAGLALMTLLTVLAVVAWARLVSLEAYDKMTFATTSIKGHTSAFMYYCFHGYAFSQPVLAVITWMGIAMCGFFDVRPLKDASARTQDVRTQDPKSPCRCGSGRQFRRCCGKTTRK